MDMVKIKGAMFVVCILIACFGQAQAQSTDVTTRPEAAGTFVVTTTLQMVDRLVEVSNDLQPDYRFMRRLAWIETEDGTAAGSFSNPAYHGGIWRVDRSVYDITRNMFNSPEYNSIFEAIEETLGINWIQTSWSDCRKPIHSALAARLYFHSLQPTIPRGLTDQVMLWWENYHAQPTDTVENFIRKVSSLEGSYAALCTLILEQTQDRGKDLTIEPGTSGAAVVEATLYKIGRLTRINDGLGQDQSVFPPDNMFMRRLAWAETRDGTADFTYSDPEYHGGIWRVDRSVYEATRKMYDNPDYRAVFAAIGRILCIEWIETSWQDCRRPLYSALAARLYFHSKSQTIPSGTPSQDEFRETTEYHDQPTIMDSTFVESVTELESNNECRVRGIDLVFVLDSSGSVESRNFETMKDFVLSVIDFFEIGFDGTRVGVIKYSSGVTVEFHLNRYADKTLLTEAIANIRYVGGQTETVSALEVMESTSFLVNNGARPASEGIPRVAVVITDGESQGPEQVAVPADRARENGITIFAIGVANANDAELVAIANQPSDTYVFHVTNFDAIASIGSTLQDTTCNQATPVTTPVINGTLDRGDTQFLQRTVTDEGVSLVIEASDGDVVMYVSITTPNPNEALYDYRLEATEGEGAVELFLGPDDFNNPGTGSTVRTGSTVVRRRRQAASQNGIDAGTPVGTVYMTIEGLKDTNNFVLMVAEGDVTQPKPVPTSGCGMVATTPAYITAIVLTAVFVIQLMIVLF